MEERGKLRRREDGREDAGGMGWERGGWRRGLYGGWGRRRRRRDGTGKEGNTTHAGDTRLFVALGVDGPLPVGTDGIVEGEAGGEDDGDGLVRGVFEPVELAVVDEHRDRDERCLGEWWDGNAGCWWWMKVVHSP